MSQRARPALGGRGGVLWTRRTKRNAVALPGPAMLPAAAATRAVVFPTGAITLAPQNVLAAGSLVAVGPVEVPGRARTVPTA